MHTKNLFGFYFKNASNWCYFDSPNEGIHNYNQHQWIQQIALNLIPVLPLPKLSPPAVLFIPWIAISNSLYPSMQIV